VLPQQNSKTRLLHQLQTKQETTKTQPNYQQAIANMFRQVEIKTTHKNNKPKLSNQENFVQKIIILKKPS
jgi:hypothetical protein